MISRISGIDRYVRDLGAIVSPFRCSDVGNSRVYVLVGSKGCGFLEKLGGS